MSMKDHLIKLQQRRINGPFERVLYIPPYSDRLLKFPTTRLGRFLKLFALVFMLLIPVLFFCQDMGAIEGRVSNAYLLQLAQQVNLQITNVTRFLEIEQRLTVILLSTLSFFICLMMVVLANTLAKRSVFVNWKGTARRTTARIVDKELQMISIGTPGRGRPKKAWQYRLRVAFTYNDRTYEATPSCINRLNPGTASKYFPNEEEARREFDSYQDHVAIEFDPSNPLDCELGGMVEWQAREFNKQFIYIFGFLIGALVVAYALITISRNNL